MPFITLTLKCVQNGSRRCELSQPPRSLSPPAATVASTLVLDVAPLASGHSQSLISGMSAPCSRA